MFFSTVLSLLLFTCALQASSDDMKDDLKETQTQSIPLTYLNESELYDAMLAKASAKVKTASGSRSEKRIFIVELDFAQSKGLGALQKLALQNSVSITNK